MADDSFPVGVVKELDRLARCYEVVSSDVNDLRVEMEKLNAKLPDDLLLTVYGGGGKPGLITCNALNKQSLKRLWVLVMLMLGAVTSMLIKVIFYA